MANRGLIVIKFGEKACASSPGVFCDFVRTKNFGTKFHCHLFEEELFDKEGWLQRCTSCLTRFGGKEGD